MDNEVIKAFVKYLKKEGFGEIKANVKGFESPDEVKAQHQSTGIVPNLTANSSGKMYLFEFEDLRYDVESEIIPRWKMLSNYAQKKQGEFFLVIEENRVDQIKSLLEENELEGIILPVALY